MDDANRRVDFSSLYQHTVEQVYRYHLARTGSHADAEDLTAETFHAALKTFNRLRESEPALPWLMGIARHKLADHLRRSLLPRGLRERLGLTGARRRSLPIEAAAGLSMPGPSIEEQAGRRLELDRVMQALRALHPERAEAVALHYFAGLSMEEVGLALGKSEEAAKKQVQRGLAELRNRLEAGRSEECGAGSAGAPGLPSKGGPHGNNA